MTRQNVRKQGWVFPLFSSDSDDRLSLNFHRFFILDISCGTRSVGLGQYCLPKVSNGFNRWLGIFFSIRVSFQIQFCLWFFSRLNLFHRGQNNWGQVYKRKFETDNKFTMLIPIVKEYDLRLAFQFFRLVIDQ